MCSILLPEEHEDVLTVLGPLGRLYVVEVDIPIQNTRCCRLCAAVRKNDSEVPPCIGTFGAEPGISELVSIRGKRRRNREILRAGPRALIRHTPILTCL